MPIITSNEKVIADLQKSLAWMDIVLANLSEGVLIVSADYKVLFANDAIATMLDQSRIFLLGNEIWDCLALTDTKGKACTKKWFISTLTNKNVYGMSGIYTLTAPNQTFIVEVTFGYINKFKQTIIIVKDITRQNNDAALLAQETAFVRLHQQTAAAANESHSVEQAMQTCLTLICKQNHWQLGQVYLQHETEPTQLKILNSWYSENPKRFKAFRKITESSIFNKGTGLPGTVFSSGKPILIIDIPQANNFPRKHEAKKTGIKGAFAFPILIHKKVVGVLEFFSAHSLHPNEKLVAVMAHIGTELGRVIERKQAEEKQLRLVKEKTARIEAEAAQEKIKLSEIRYRTIIEQSPLSMQILSPEGITVQVNTAWEKLWGATLKDITGYNMLKDQQLVETGVMSYIQKGFRGEPSMIPAIKYEPEKTIKNISVVSHKWVQAYIYPIKDEHGSIKEIILVHQDITERKELERQKDEFLGIASHELKTPVTSIKAYGQVLQTLFRRKGDLQASEQLGKMDAQINKLTHLIGDLLDVTKIQSGSWNFKRHILILMILYEK